MIKIQEVDALSKTRIENVSREITNLLKKSNCVKCDVELDTINGMDIMYTICSSAEIRWWHVGSKSHINCVNAKKRYNSHI